MDLPTKPRDFHFNPSFGSGDFGWNSGWALQSGLKWLNEGKLTLDGNCWKIETNEGFKPNNWRFTEPKWHKSFSKCSEAHAGSKLSWPKTCFVNIYIYVCIYKYIHAYVQKQALQTLHSYTYIALHYININHYIHSYIYITLHTLTTCMHAYIHTCMHAYIHTERQAGRQTDITYTAHITCTTYLTYIIYITTLHYIMLHFIILHYIALRCVTLHYVTYNITLGYITLRSATLRCVTFNYILYITLHLHCFALHSCRHTYIHTNIHTYMHACIRTYKTYKTYGTYKT